MYMKWNVHELFEALNEELSGCGCINDYRALQQLLTIDHRLVIRKMSYVIDSLTLGKVLISVPGV